MVDIHSKIKYIKTIDTATELEMLEEFKLGLEEAWERECSSNSDVDKFLLTNRTCHLSTGLLNSCLHKEF